jgi:glycosyltransferase involved in cell wall biosynthesis
MNILIVEPFYTGSHAAWAEGYARDSVHEARILKLSGAHWKWRMHGGAVTLARKFLEGGYEPDLIFATDMLDLTTFLALTRRQTAGVPCAVYFHENQLTYPWSPKDRDQKRDRDKHYSFINLSSALAADRVFFNSRYHMESFFDELPGFLNQFPDHQEAGQIERLRAKSSVLQLGLDLRSFDKLKPPPVAPGAGGDTASSGAGSTPIVLWNHRWEYDKNPDEFFEALHVLANRGHDFRVVVVGEQFDLTPEAFTRARETLGDRVVHYGYVDDRAGYAGWLWRSDILPVTSRHDFFGASVMEAVYCGCLPLLPRRLAYPELIPEELHGDCFYDTFEELVERLDALMRETDQPPHDGPREAAARFDWRTTAPLYDAALVDTFEAKVSD